MNIAGINYPKRFVIFSLTLFLLIFILENINHRFWLNDFKVYYMAGKALLEGAPVYGDLFALGSGYYKYSPFTAVMVLPFCLFDFEAAKVLQYIILSFTITSLFVLAGFLIRKYFFIGNDKTTGMIYFAALFCTINHLFRELHLGNINVLLLFLVCFSLFLNLNKKLFYAGCVLTLVLMTKPFFGLLVLPFALRGNYKVIFGIFISSIVFILLPSLITGINQDLLLHKEWIQTIQEHNSGFPSFNTLAYMLGKYTSMAFPGWFQWVILALVLGGYLFLHFYLKRTLKKETSYSEIQNADFLFESFLLLSVLPNLFKTDTQHFLLTLPLIILLLFYIFQNRNPKIILLFSFLIIFYGWNLSALFGKHLSTVMDEYGFLGLSNIFILAFSVFVYVKKIRPRIMNLHPGIGPINSMK